MDFAQGQDFRWWDSPLHSGVRSAQILISASRPSPCRKLEVSATTGLAYWSYLCSGDCIQVFSICRISRAGHYSNSEVLRQWQNCPLWVCKVAAFQM